MHITCTVLLFVAHSEHSSTSSSNLANTCDMFKEPMSISVAFSKLFNHLCIGLKDCDVSALKVEIIKRTSAPDGVNLQKSTEDKIKSAKSVDDLILAIDDPSYCNWADIRLLEVLANCTSPNAVEVIDAYKRFLCAKKLKAVLPRQEEPNLQQAYITAVSTMLNMCPDEITVGDFLWHFRDEAVFDLVSQKLNIDTIRRGRLN